MASQAGEASVANLCNGRAASILVRPRVMRPVTNEELPARHTAILCGELCTAAHIEQANLTTPNSHLHVHMGCT